MWPAVKTDLLIRNAELGDALAKTVGSAAVVLMRGHGSTVVGSSLPVAVYRAIYTEVNAKARSQPLNMGEVLFFLTEEEARLADINSEQHIIRPESVEVPLRALGTTALAAARDGRLTPLHRRP